MKYENLNKSTQLVAGIVLHKTNMNGYTTDLDKGYISYADSTDDRSLGNGVIFVGLAFPTTPALAYEQWFSPADQKTHSGAMGHVLAQQTYKPGEAFTYYWGSGWSKHDIKTYEAWNKYMADFVKRIKSPLKVTVKQ